MWITFLTYRCNEDEGNYNKSNNTPRRLNTSTVGVDPSFPSELVKYHVI